MEIGNLVDAGPLIGWLNASDQWHQWAVEPLSAVHGPLHTTEIVLGEACWHLGGNTQPVHALLGLVRAGAIQLVHPWPGGQWRAGFIVGYYLELGVRVASGMEKHSVPPRSAL